MKFFTALLSLVFSVVGMALAIIIAVQLSSTDTEVFIVGMILLACFSWMAFFFLDWLYRKLHPAVYQTSLANLAPHPGFNFNQAVLSALRSAFLNLAVPVVSLGLWFVFLGLPILLSGKLENDMLQVFSFALLALLIIAIIGILVQWSYKRSVLRLMMEQSSKRPARSKRMKNATRSRKLNLRLLDTSKKISLSKRGAKKQSIANRIERLGLLRDTGAPLAAVAGILAIAAVLQLDTFQNSEYAIRLLIAWLSLFVLAYLGSTLRLADRQPFRQFRLGFGMLLQALLLALSSPFLLLFELTGRQGLPHEQWAIISKTGAWVSQLLRSPRLFWYLAILLASLFPILNLASGSSNLASPLSETGIYLLTGILSFEAIYGLFNLILRRQKGLSNRLVFLRVFGDPGRGRFLFRHLVPRWKGLGSITCIAAPDVSIHQLEADIGFYLLFTGLHRRFLSREESQVIGRHINSETLGAVIEDHCFDDTWMTAVNSLLTQNAIVLMDLRGFTPQRKGCIYELGVLRDHISMDSVVFLIDDSTDYKFLEKTLTELWKSVSVNSPNSKAGSFDSTKPSQVTIFRMEASKSVSARELSKLLIEAGVATESYHQQHGQVFLKQLIEDLQLLAADADTQVKAVGGGRTPGKKILEAGYSSDHDLGHTHFLSSWGLINDQQYNAISEVNDAVQEVRINGEKQTAATMKNDPDWQQLRLAARNCLKALGKRKRSPTLRK